MHTDPQFVNYLQNIVEVLGTMAFAISGIRHAAAKKYDWFGGFVCGVAVAIGGGTIRDLMLGQTPFWMTTPLYLLCTFFAQFITIAFAKLMKRLDNAKKEGLEEGLIKGERNKAMEIATKMKAKGFSVDDIVQMTGLSADEVKKIKH